MFFILKVCVLFGMIGIICLFIDFCFINEFSICINVMVVDILWFLVFFSKGLNMFNFGIFKVLYFVCRIGRYFFKELCRFCI